MFSSRRSWLWRAFFAALTLVLAGMLVIVFIGPAHIGAVWQQVLGTSPLPTVTLSGRDPQPVGTGGWVSYALPGQGNTIRGMDVSPTDPRTIFVCTGPAQSGFNPPPVGTLRLWRTHDSGRHWATVSLPALTGSSCQVQIAGDAPLRMLLAVSSPTGHQRPCTGITLYLSDDGGNSWKSSFYNSPAPAGSQEIYCNLWPTEHHLYSEISFSQGEAGTSQSRQIARLQRSDDDGISWQVADTAFGGDSLFYPWQNDDENTIIANVWMNGGKTTLWMTQDAGRHWSQFGPSAGDAFVMAASSAPDDSHPIYTLEGEQVNHITIYESFDGHIWSRIPRLPLPNVQGKAPNIAEIVAALPDGSLLALGDALDMPAIPTSSPASLSKETQWLWIWNPRVGRWDPVIAPLTLTEGCALCWEHFITRVPEPDSADLGTYVWIYDSAGMSDVIYGINL